MTLTAGPWYWEILDPQWHWSPLELGEDKVTERPVWLMALLG